MNFSHLSRSHRSVPLNVSPALRPDCRGYDITQTRKQGPVGYESLTHQDQLGVDDTSRVSEVVTRGMCGCKRGYRTKKARFNVPADVLQDLVCGAVLAQGQSRVRGTNLHVLLAVGDALADLVVHPTGGEVRERSGEWDFPTNGHACGDAHHVGLGNAHLEESVGERVLEGVHFQRTCQVSAKAHHIAVGLAGFKQALAEAGAGVFVLCGVEKDVM